MNSPPSGKSTSKARQGGALQDDCTFGVPLLAALNHTARMAGQDAS